MSAITTVYVERGVAEHPRTRAVLRRLPRARIVDCERYGEVFNRRAQNFRAQKARPSLILAHKHDGHVLAAPAGYHIGAARNYYFSHLLNCPYDCRYCFLQGMYRSAHYVLFVDFEGYRQAIDRRLDETPGDEVHFFSGYDGDSLALEGISGFCQEFVPWFAARPRALLELRTKSASVGPLEELEPAANTVVAFSFTPEAARRRWEIGVPTVERRLAAMERLGQRGWKLGLRFDPVVWWPDCRQAYAELFASVFGRLRDDWLHSVSLGTFRLPAPFFRRMTDLYPEEPLFAAPLERHGSMIAYRGDLERELTAFCLDALMDLVEPGKLFPCPVSGARPPMGPPGDASAIDDARGVSRVSPAG